MMIEANSEHVENFALHPICTDPKWHNTLDGFRLSDISFYTKALVAAEGKQLINHVKAPFALWIIGGGQIRRERKASLIPKITAYFQILFPRNNQIVLGQIRPRLNSLIRESSLYGLRQFAGPRITARSGRLFSGRLWRVSGWRRSCRFFARRFDWFFVRHPDYSLLALTFL